MTTGGATGAGRAGSVTAGSMAASGAGAGSATALAPPPDRTDAELAAAAAAGEAGAIDDLYRRHVSATSRVAGGVTRDPDDAADAVSEAFSQVVRALSAGRLTDHAAFRPYLLAATRHAAIDIVRRRRRTRPMGDDDLTDLPRAEDSADVVVNAEDSALVMRAFRELPQRWQSVLWLTEVEGRSPVEAGRVLGLKPNAVSQLALRARARLRTRYLQAHVGGGAREDCRFTVEHLAAFVDGTLASRAVSRVDRHLDGCSACRDRVDQLSNLGIVLRQVLPVPVLMAGGGVLRRMWRHLAGIGGNPPLPAADAVASHSSLAATVTSVAAHTDAALPSWAAGVAEHLVAASPVAQRLMAGVAAGALAVGVSAVALHSDAPPPPPDARAVGAPAPVQGSDLAPAAMGRGGGSQAPPADGPSGPGGGAAPGSAAPGAPAPSGPADVVAATAGQGGSSVAAGVGSAVTAVPPVPAVVNPVTAAVGGGGPVGAVTGTVASAPPAVTTVTDAATPVTGAVSSPAPAVEPVVESASPLVQTLTGALPR